MKALLPYGRKNGSLNDRPRNSHSRVYTSRLHSLLILPELWYDASHLNIVLQTDTHSSCGVWDPLHPSEVLNTAQFVRRGNLEVSHRVGPVASVNMLTWAAFCSASNTQTSGGFNVKWNKKTRHKFFF